MKGVVVQAGTAHIDMTGVAFMTYAQRYREAAIKVLINNNQEIGFDPALYQLLAQSLELHLKSYIWLVDKISWKKIKSNYGHNIQKLWSDSKDLGIDKFAKVTPLRDRVISLINKYYHKRRFCYLDMEMIFKGFKDLDSEPKAINTLLRLTLQLKKSLRDPILKSSQTNN